MKIAIVKNNTEESTNVARKLREMLAKENIEITTSQPNIIISVGGDGTLLSAFHRYAHLLDKVRFIGVHTGHLGFYTDWRQYNLEELVDSLVNDNGEYIQYPLLDIEIIYKNKQKNKHFLALNESIVKFTDGTLVGDVYIKENISSDLEETDCVFLLQQVQQDIINQLVEQCYTQDLRHCNLQKLLP